MLILYLSVADSGSSSIQQGVYLLKPNKEGYNQQKDGSVVDARGKTLSPGKVLIHVCC